MEPGACPESFCLPFLLQTQNADGGWGFRPGGQSSVEVTAATLLALGGAREEPVVEEAKARALDWMYQAQLRDGSWPAFPNQPQGCWVTSMACLALQGLQGHPDSLEQGLGWIVRAWPGEGGFWWRLRGRLTRRSSIVAQNPSLRGWSWTPGTSSWVEPTSLALILFSAVPEQMRPRGAAKRRQLGEMMLYDRMCPGGGWNCGNPMVYGVAGEPAVGPTAWALLALQSRAERGENQQSLSWLSEAYPRIQGPASLALAHLCLRVYGRSPAPLEPELHRLHQSNQFLHSVQAVAWATLALRPLPGWLSRASREGQADEQ